jgi:hypothetical protein
MPHPARADYNGAELRAIFFNKEKAANIGAPLVLMAHRTHCKILGNGPRETHEHRIWYIGDPTHPLCAAVREPGVLLNHTIESFGLKRCRIIRGLDTLRVATDEWKVTAPRGWPPEGYEPWIETHTELPELRRGDIVEISYSITNRWSRNRLPSDWELLPIRSPVAPTIERHIVITYNRALQGEVKVLGDTRRILRHHGGGEPKLELLTGNLPPDPADADSLNGARVLFTAGKSWHAVHGVLRDHCAVELNNGTRFLAEIGDSLMRTHRRSRERMRTIFDHIEQRCARIPRSLLSSEYYPRLLALAYEGRATDPLDRALLIAALARAATLKAEIFLGRSTREGFDPEFITPMQFDRVVLRFFVAEEDRHVLLDPWEPDLDRALHAVSTDAVFLGIEQDWPGLYELDEHGQLVPYETQ